ncbi:MAG: IS1634 family transposase [Acetobacteraceae bacterium]|nr:IS1634 family transposase [Acetobacteraceae bacterium]
MFFRIKPAGERRYLQIVENKRDGHRTVQRVLATLGRIEDLEADGRLETLLRSGARFCETAMLISTLRAGTLEGASSLRIGPPMVFGRLWERAGYRAVMEQLAAGRNFGFPLERAIFVSVLHRLMVSGSDRACEKWLDGYQIDGADGLELHKLYRAIAWLGEELADQSGATRAPRRIKDLIEKALFQRRRSLLSDLSMVLFDTTSLMFYGAGGDSLGQRGKSKDHRPDLKQVVVGVVLDEAGRPICSETWPGNAADVKALLPVVRRLRERLGISRMCVVADRGMISAETINELEAHGVEYILGARERNSAEVRRVVLADEKPMIPLVIPRARGAETALEVKEVMVGDWGPGCHPRRYVVCFNPEEAKRDAAVREAILDSLHTKLQQGDKALLGNAGYRRFLSTPRDGHFEIDPARITEDARFDGIYVLRTNSKLPVLSVALAYRQLWKVEAIFRTAKSILETRPIYHQSDAAIAGHLFCSFLSLLLRKELDERLSAAGITVEWDDVVRDLDRVEQITIEQNPKRFRLRPDAPGCAGSVFKAVGVALPPLVSRLPPPSITAEPPPRRGHPRRGATRP